ncbi:MAG: pitrilysin family protein [Myxococcota bacterium]
MTTSRTLRLMLALLLAACSSSKSQEKPAPAPAAPAPATDDPTLGFERYTLKNGLTVILHEDHRVPVVAVDVWYRVGSFHEAKGRSGFAHLFEHLMFQGSRHVGDDQHFRMMEEVGANDLNGTTDFDRTNYFQTVPREELPLALWLESDRMGYLLDTLTQKKLDNQRSVVKNEKRQSIDGAPYGLAYLALFHALFPEGHPYRDTPIGRFEDLNAATLEDVRQFFLRYYAPSNATLTLAGDFDPAVAKALIEKAFGGLAAREQPVTPTVVTPALSGETRQVVDEPVAPLAQVTLAYLSPPAFAPGDTELDVLETILSAGKGSRLYRALVETQLAQRVSADQESYLATGIFSLTAGVTPGHTADEVEKAMDAVITQLATEGPTAEEVARAKSRLELALLMGLERVGGLGGRAELLQTYHLFAKDPGYLPKHLAELRAVTPEKVRDVARRVLRPDARVVQHAIPRKDANAAAAAEAGPPPAEEDSGHPQLPPADPWRAQPPEPLPTKLASLPVAQREVLENGLTVLAVPQRGLPLVSLMLVSRHGGVMDPQGKEGRATLATTMLTEGMDGVDAATQADRFADLGTQLHVRTSLETSSVGAVVHRRDRDGALALLSRTLAAPTFSADAFGRAQTRAVTGLRERLHDPMGVAMHLMTRAGAGEHPYGRPREGTLPGLQAVTVDDVKAAHAAAWTARNMALVAVGDITLQEAVALARTHLGAVAQGEALTALPNAPAARKREAIWAVDLPGSPQTVVLLARPSVGAQDPDEPAVTLMNAALGGNFSSRLNLNLREDKGITYGAFSFTASLRQGGVLVAMAPVQSDAVGVGVREAFKEVAGMSERPVTDEELKLAKDSNSRSLPGQFESVQGTAGAMASLFAADLPLDYYATLPGRYAAVTREDQVRLARAMLKPDEMQLLLIGDRKAVEAAVTQEKLGTILWLDSEGKPLPVAAPAPAAPAPAPTGKKKGKR